jgi:hypothetical protein
MRAGSTPQLSKGFRRMRVARDCRLVHGSRPRRSVPSHGADACRHTRGQLADWMEPVVEEALLNQPGSIE